MCWRRSLGSSAAFWGPGLGFQVSIRGSSPDQVEVYLDNVLLNSANAGSWIPGLLSLDTSSVSRFIGVLRRCTWEPDRLLEGDSTPHPTGRLARRPNSARASYGSFEFSQGDAVTRLPQHFDTSGTFLCSTTLAARAIFSFSMITARV